MKGFKTVMENISNVNLTPYAKLFINYQQPGGDLFEPDEALYKGTVFPALYIPYKNKWEVKRWLEKK